MNVMGNNNRPSLSENRIIIICTTDSMISSFLIPYIEKFTKDGYTVQCFCSRTGASFDKLLQKNIDVNDVSFTRFPVSISNLKGYRKLKKSIRKSGAKMIFCHEPVGGFMGRIVGRRRKIPVVYMVHGFHFYKGAPKINWMLYYPIERISSYFTNVLITINHEDYDIAKQHMHAKKTEYLSGVGIDIRRFSFDSELRVSIRRDFGLSDEDIALFSVGELNVNKNHIVILEAMKMLQNNNLHYYVAGVGDQEKLLLSKAREYGLENNFHLLGYRTDCDSLYSAMDIFCFPSYREGLSVALMEAMSCGLPVIASHIRGNVDLVDPKGGILVDPCNAAGFAEAIDSLSKSEEYRLKLGNHNSEIIRDYSIKSVIPQFENSVKDILSQEVI